MRKLFILFIVLIIGAVICAPLISGMWLQQKYQALLQGYETNPNFTVTLVKYQRHWFSSDALVNVEIKNFQNSTLSFTVSQHISHGPYLFVQNKKFPTQFALAAIHNKISFSKDSAALLEKSGINESWLNENDGLITFSGNIFNYFSAGKMLVDLPGVGEDVSFSGVEGMLCVNPEEERISGDLALHDLVIFDPVSTVKFSSLNMKFDQHKDIDGIWLGSHSVVFPDFIFKTVNGDRVAVYGMNLHGDTNESSGEFRDLHNISIDKISIMDRHYGPIRIRLSASKFNLKILRDMLAVYEDISRNGEFYQYELQHRLLTLLPQIIIPGSNIDVEQIDIGSSFGNLHLQGNISWPAHDFVTPDSVIDIGQSSTVKMNMNVSKPLVNDVIDYMSGMPDFIRMASEPDRAKLIEMKSQLDFCMRENLALIAFLEQEENITSGAADQLLAMQEQLVPMELYSSTVKKLYWSREVTLAARLWLNWQYSQVIEPYEYMVNRVDVYQAMAKKQMHDEVKRLLAEHFVQQSDDTYSVQMTWSNGQLKLNGMAAW